jgi:hypothetical protein
MQGGRLNTGFEELDADECFELLGQSGIGRLVVAGERGRPEIFPVYYFMAGRRVLFWTDTGTKLTASTGREVAFEVDHADPAAKTGWSVIVRGLARQWDPRQFRRRPTPWINTVRPFLIAIDATEVTGRRIQPSASSHQWPPWAAGAQAPATRFPPQVGRLRSGAGQSLVDGLAARGPQRHVRQRERLEMPAHVLPDVRPHGEQHALALVITGPVLMGFAEIAGDDRAFHRADDLTEGDVLGMPGQHVAASDPALRANQARALEGQEDLLQVRLGESGALGNVSHRGRLRLAGVQRQRQQRSTGVVAPGRNLH